MDNLLLVVITSLLSGLIGVSVTLAVQKRTAKRAEKMSIFKALMSARDIGELSYETVQNLNIIDVVFYNVDNVISAWKKLHQSYIDNGNISQKTHNSTNMLLQEMAKHLGYKNINWDTITHSYLSYEMIDAIQSQPVSRPKPLPEKLFDASKYPKV